MTSQQLARKTFRGNFLDQLEEAIRRIRRLEEVAIKPESDGTLALPGVLLEVLTAAPTAPPTGYVKLYAELDGTTTYLRAQDEEGTVKDLDSWV